MQPQTMLMRCRHAAGMDAIAANHVLHGSRLVTIGECDVQVVIGDDLNVFRNSAHFGYG